MPHSLIHCKKCGRCTCAGHDTAVREEEYRRRSFERVGLHDVAAISMALRRLSTRRPNLA